MQLPEPVAQDLGLTTIVLPVGQTEDSLRERLPEDCSLLSDPDGLQTAVYYINSGNPLYLTPKGTWYMPMTDRQYLNALHERQHYSRFNYRKYISTGDNTGSIMIANIPPTQYILDDGTKIEGEFGHTAVSVTNARKTIHGRTLTLHAGPAESVRDRLKQFFNGEITLPIKFEETEHPHAPITACAIFPATERMLDVHLVDRELAKVFSEPGNTYTMAELGLTLKERYNYKYGRPVADDVDIGNCVTATADLVTGILRRTIFPLSHTNDATDWTEEIYDYFDPQKTSGDKTQTLEIDLRHYCRKLDMLTGSVDEQEFKIIIKSRRVNTHMTEFTAVDASEASSQFSKLLKPLEKKGIKLSKDDAFSARTILQILEDNGIEYIPERQLPNSPSVFASKRKPENGAHER